MMTPKNFISAIATSVLTMLSNIADAQNAPSFPIIPLNAGIYVIKAEVASNNEQREYGLMFRQRLAQNEGMVFLFESPQVVCMWMKNTLIPLSVAFIDNEGKITNVEEMKPQTLDSHCSNKKVTYALEMNSGWFKQKNLKSGNLIEGLPGVP